MREMMLNQASLASPDRHTAVDWLRDVTAGIALLTQHGVVESTLRMSKPHTETFCMANWSLWDALLEMQRVGAREEFRLFSKLTSKIPLLIDVGQDVKNRFHFCEVKTLPLPDGEPLVLAAITDGITIGFPSESVWDKHQITVTFEEMLPSSSISEISETIDNVTRSAHAQLICSRHHDRIRGGLHDFRDGTALWEARKEAFLYLTFGPDVEDHLSKLNPGLLGTVINKLVGLNEAAAKWHEVGGPTPPWGSRVTEESDSVKNDDKLLEARRFRSTDGTRQLFTWHARYGSGGRIHLSFEREIYEIEIGYIGNHLPL